MKHTISRSLRRPKNHNSIYVCVSYNGNPMKSKKENFFLGKAEKIVYRRPKLVHFSFYSSNRTKLAGRWATQISLVSKLLTSWTRFKDVLLSRKQGPNYSLSGRNSNQFLRGKNYNQCVQELYRTARYGSFSILTNHGPWELQSGIPKCIKILMSMHFVEYSFNLFLSLFSCHYCPYWLKSEMCMIVVVLLS